MKQFVGCLETPTFPRHVQTYVLGCFQHLLYNPHTHKYLTNVDLIGALMKVAYRSPSHPFNLKIWIQHSAQNLNLIV